MSTPHSEPRRRVAHLFEATGHEVTSMATEEPGRVVHLVQPGTGLIRARTYWVIWEQCPVALDQALAALEQEGAHYGAERVLAVVVSGPLPSGYEPRLRSQPASAITLRRLTLELTGLADMVRRFAEIGPEDPCHPALFLDRKLITEDERIVPAVEHIEEWLDDGQTDVLGIAGSHESGRATLVRHVAYHRAIDFLRDPEHVTPLIPFFPLVDTAGEPRHSLRDIAPLLNPDWLIFFKTSFSDTGVSIRGFRFIDLLSKKVNYRLDLTMEVASMRAPEPDEVMAWYRARLAPARYAALTTACRHTHLFADFACMLVHLSDMLATLGEMDVGNATRPDSTDAWIAAVIHRFMYRFLASFIDEEHMEELLALQDGVLEDAALEDLVLGTSRSLLGIYEYDELSAKILTEKGLVHTFPPHSWIQHDGSSRFANQLLRDYFLARKIASEVRAERLDILTRHQLPERYVLLFLALLAPDVAARLSAERGEALHARQRSAVEHEVQLIVAHQLLRSAGALRSNIRRLRQSMPAETIHDCEHELARVDQELDFLSALADRTRRWHEVPETDHERVAVASVIDSALQPLREEHPEVQIDSHVAPDIMTVTSREGLGEIFHYLLENAFQAVTGPDHPQESRIAIRLVVEHAGKTILVEITNNGPAVPEQDRERIFEPRVTTKKGGPGQPLGTGMGLAIARRYATHLGVWVGLDTAHAETCFYIRLVADWIDT